MSKKLKEINRREFLSKLAKGSKLAAVAYVSNKAYSLIPFRKSRARRNVKDDYYGV